MKPILVHYYLNYRCNVRCEFCNIWDPAVFDATIMASMDEIAENLTQARSLGVRFVDFTGGEPLLCPHLPQALTVAQELGFRTSVTTNCVLYPKRAGELAGLVDLLHFSLDSFDKAEHNDGRGYDCYDSVMESVDVALSLGEKPDILFTATDRTVSQTEALVRFVRTKRLMLIINPVFDYFENGGISSDGLDHIEKFAWECGVYVNWAFHRLIRAGGNQTDNPRCRAVSSTIVISPDNRLLLPCFHGRDGDVSIDGDLAAARSGEGWHGFQKSEGRLASCQGCTINCYFDPSFLFVLDGYWWRSVLSKAKYAFDKWVRPQVGPEPNYTPDLQCQTERAFLV